MDQINENLEGTTLIHFVFQASPERIACMPGMTEFHATSYHPAYQRTNDPNAVTCPGCRATRQFKKNSAISAPEK